MAQVSLEQVRKVYGATKGGQDFIAVEGATFDVADGELLVLVGPSGCGKSTLLRMIAGLEEITSGTLRIGDRIVNDVAPKDRDIAMVFQNYALYPHMTVAANLAFGLKLRGVPPADIARRVDDAARVLELGTLLDRRPAALSGGQRQRVALGRALVRDPQVFLLDEPLSNLDAKLRAGMRVEIARLHRQVGATMVYVTHDQVEAMTLGQRIVVLKDGRVQQIDTPMALYERPANLFVATFLGSPAMNILRGRLVRADGLALDLGDGLRVPLEGRDDVPEAWHQRDIAVGVRPEHLLPAGDGSAALEPTIEMIEALGNETLVNVRLGPHALVSRMAPRTLPSPGMPLPLALAPGQWHAFDADTGDRL